MPTRNYAYAMAAADIMREQGRINATRDYGKAQAWGNLVRGIPANVMGLVQQRDARADRAQAQSVRDLQRQSAELSLKRQTKDFASDQAISDVIAKTPRGEGGTMDYGAVAREVSFIDPVRGMQIQQMGDAQKERAERMVQEKAQKNAQEIARALGDATDDTTWAAARTALEKKKIDVSGFPDTFDKASRDVAIQKAMTFDSWVSSKFGNKPTRLITTKDASGAETAEIVEDIPGVKRTGAALVDPVKFPRGPETRLVDGKRQDVLYGSDGNAYLPGDAKTPLSADRVKPLPEKQTGDTTRVITTKNPDGSETTEIVPNVVGVKRTGAAPPPKGITPVMRQQAGARKVSRLLALEEAFRASQGGPTADTSGLSPDAQAILAAFRTQRGGQKAPVTPEDLDARKLIIENAYRAEIGEPPVLSISEAGYQPSARPGAPTAPAAPVLPPAQSAGAPTPSPPRPAPAAPPAAKASGAPILVTVPDGKGGTTTISFTPEAYEKFKKDAEKAGYTIK